MPYSTLPQQLYTAEQSRELDSLAINELKIQGYTLMERAANAAFDCLLQHYPNLLEGAQLKVVCGAGNNAGDGYLLAAIAAKNQIDVELITVAPPKSLKNDAALAFQKCKKTTVKIKNYQLETEFKADVIVDALLGTGLTKEITGVYREVIEKLNLTPFPVFSLDIPSGLNSNTGAAQPIAVLAEHTICFISVKAGLVTGAGPRYCGELHFHNLNIPPIKQALDPNIQAIDGKNLLAQLPIRKADANKGDNGHLLVIGGDYGMAGASIMAAEAALFTGCGLVSLATRKEHCLSAMIRRPEIMAKDASTACQISQLLEGKNAIVVGPGLGRSSWAKMLLKAAWVTTAPLLVDADALYLMKELNLPKRKDPLVITPHPKEAAHLLNCSTFSVEKDRFAAAHQIQEKYGAIVVLKGAGSLIAHTHNKTEICLTGNPGMAIGGMGDVLSGVIAALLLQHNFTAPAAAKLGTWLHATAADEVVKIQGQKGLLATELFAYIRKLINRVNC